MSDENTPSNDDSEQPANRKPKRVDLRSPDPDEYLGLSEISEETTSRKETSSEARHRRMLAERDHVHELWMRKARFWSILLITALLVAGLIVYAVFIGVRESEAKWPLGLIGVIIAVLVGWLRAGS